MVESHSSEDNVSQIGAYQVIKDGRAFCAVNKNNFERDFPLCVGDEMDVTLPNDGWAVCSLSYSSTPNVLLESTLVSEKDSFASRQVRHSLWMRRNELHRLIGLQVVKKMTTA